MLLQVLAQPVSGHLALQVLLLQVSAQPVPWVSVSTAWVRLGRRAWALPQPVLLASEWTAWVRLLRWARKA